MSNESRVGDPLLAGILEASPFGIFWKNLALVYLGCNHAYARCLGLSSPAEVIGRTDEELLAAEYAAESRECETAVISSGAPLVRRFRGSGAPGSVPSRGVICRSPLRDGSGKIIGVGGFLDRVSLFGGTGVDGKYAERARALLQRCTTCILSVDTEASLLDQLCLLILGAGYRMVWFGAIENDAGRAIRPIAHGGFSANYLDSLHVTWRDVPLGRGPTGTAVRERRTVVNQNFQTNPATRPWRESALAQGFHSSIAVPIVYLGETLSVLTIYATEPDAFDDDEVQLLEELARNISIGLGALRERSRRLTELAAANEALANLARHDELTDLPNRLAANERLHLEFVTMKRTNRHYAVLMMDVDHFKKVNDDHGHAVGDRVLAGIGRILKKTIRKRDSICRLGGEEFLAILPETGADGALVVAEKLRQAVSEHDDPVAGRVTLSIGVAIAASSDETEDDAVKTADEHLYKAKSLGRNLVVI